MNEHKKRFVSPKFIKSYEKFSELIIEQNTDLGIKIVENGIIHPFEIHDMDNIWNKPAYGGVTDENLNYIEESALLNINFELDYKVTERVKGFNPNYDFENIKYYDETVVYIGKMDDAWGHFMNETITRLWYFVDNPDCNYRFAYISKVNDIFIDYLYLMGISPDRLIRIDEKPLKFKQVIIPEMSARINDRYHSKYKTIIDKISEKIPPAKYKKIFISRELLQAPWKKIGNDEIEDTFKENGYTIVKPELFSAKEKISLMKGADIVICTQGSGVYNLLFAKDNAKLCILNTCSICSIPLVGKIKNLDIYYVDAYQEPLPVHCGAGPFMLTLTPYLEEFFKEFGIIFDREKLLKNLADDIMHFYIWWIHNYSQETFKVLLKNYYPNVDIETISKGIEKILDNTERSYSQ